MMNMPPMEKDVMNSAQSPMKSKWSLRNKSRGKQRRVAQKDANYGARAGETIAGNLKRGADGKFSSGGGDYQLSDQEKQDLLDRVAASHAKGGGKGKGKGGKKGGGKGKGAKPKLTPEQKKQQQKDNLANNASEVLGDEFANLFTSGDYPGDISKATPQTGDRLVELGLASKAPDGSYMLNGSGNALIRAMQNDNVDAINRTMKIAERRKKLQDFRANAKADTLQARANSLRPQTSVKKEAQSFSVYKQANGLYRWVTFSSSSYYDRDGEVIPQAELEADVARADATKEYGPLLWWHTPVRLGECDFNDMVGRVLVESGTFRNEEIALAISAAMPELGVSIGYEHAPVERGPGCVFKNIRRKERSLLPRGIESNRLTKVFVTGQDENTNSTQKDSTMKFEALKKLLGEKATKELIEEAQNAEKEAQAQGLAFKAKSNPNPAAAAAATSPDAPDAIANATTKAPPPIDPTAMTGGEPDGDEEGEDLEPLPEGEPDGDEGKVMYVGDMAPVELHEMLDQLIQQKTQEALAPLKELLTSNQTAATKEVSNVTAAVRELVDLVKGVVSTNKEQAAKIETLEGQVATLTGELPRGFSSLKAVQQQSYGAGRASQSQENIVPPNSALAAAVKAAAGENPYLKAASKMLAGFGGGQPQQQ